MHINPGGYRRAVSDKFMKKGTETISPRYRGLDLWKDEDILEDVIELVFAQERAV